MSSLVTWLFQMMMILGKDMLWVEIVSNGPYSVSVLRQNYKNLNNFGFVTAKVSMTRK